METSEFWCAQDGSWYRKRQTVIGLGTEWWGWFEFLHFSHRLLSLGFLLLWLLTVANTSVHCEAHFNKWQQKPFNVPDAIRMVEEPPPPQDLCQVVFVKACFGCVLLQWNVYDKIGNPWMLWKSPIKIIPFDSELQLLVNKTGISDVFEFLLAIGLFMVLIALASLDFIIHLLIFKSFPIFNCKSVTERYFQTFLYYISAL